MQIFGRTTRAFEKTRGKITADSCQCGRCVHLTRFPRRRESCFPFRPLGTSRRALNPECCIASQSSPLPFFSRPTQIIYYYYLYRSFIRLTECTFCKTLSQYLYSFSLSLFLFIHKVMQQDAVWRKKFSLIQMWIQLWTKEIDYIHFWAYSTQGFA